ncbi:hypothetical protein CHCC20375_4366 [Bacillus licheniformis]|nr:hypothetical protein CHCC20375_4366 [Bacillus licheniformis]
MHVVPGKSYSFSGADAAPWASSTSFPMRSSSFVLMPGAAFAFISSLAKATILPIFLSPSSSWSFVTITIHSRFLFLYSISSLPYLLAKKEQSGFKTKKAPAFK